MAQITVWGDFKVNKTDNLNLSGGLQLLLNQSEINILNFEAPVRSNAKAIRKSGPNISQSPDGIKWLEDRGYNLISLANNHAMDFGEDGLRKTIKLFQNAQVMGARYVERSLQDACNYYSRWNSNRLFGCNTL